MFVSELREAVRTVQKCVRSIEPGLVSGDEARALVQLLADGERAAASGIALLAPVVARTGSYAKSGHASAGAWLGALSGTSNGAAKARLAAAERAATNPVLTEALQEGELSAPQLTLLTSTAAHAPDALSTLLPMVAGGSSHQELSDRAARLSAAARSGEEDQVRRARVHANRHFRWHRDPNGGVRGEILADEVAWSRFEPRLEQATQERWRADPSQPADAHRLDAFLESLGNTDTAAPATASPTTLVLIDATALRRGATEGDEICEIDGIGPISVQAATELLPEGAVQYLVRDGVDIRTVTSPTRWIPTRTRTALIARDRCCAVPNCGETRQLQIDHCHVDFAQGGVTAIENLARLCPPHHAMKSHGGWDLQGKPGKWRWVPPKNPPSARFIAKARKLAAIPRRN